MKGFKMYIFALIAMSAIFTAYGGWIDITESKKLTAQHMWNDGIFLLLLAVVFVHFA